MSELTGFAKACYDTLTRAELENVSEPYLADDFECVAWGLTHDQWSIARKQALGVKMAEAAAAIQAHPGSPELVWTRIDQLKDLPHASWQPRYIDSKEEAWNHGKIAFPAIDIVLMGVRIDGVVTIEYAASDRSNRLWEQVHPWHVKLAEYFMLKIEQRPAGEVPRPFLVAIDNPGLAGLVRFSLAVGGTVVDNSDDYGNTLELDDEQVKKSARDISEKLHALGVPCFDWVYRSLLNTFNGTAQP